MTTERIDLAAILQKTSLFSNLSSPEVQLLAARTVRKFFRTGEVLFYEGSPAKECTSSREAGCGSLRPRRADASRYLP